MSSAQPAPTPKYPAHLRIAGPRAVPDTTRYEYTTNCPVDADWTVGAPGSPHTAKGKNLVVTWGATEAQTTIDVECGPRKAALRVEVVHVAIDKTTVQLGGKATPRIDAPLEIVDTSGPPPAIKFIASLTVTGPTKSPAWGKRITTGFVQRLTAADASQWQGAYANNKRPTPDQSKLTADTATDPPPKSDCVGTPQTCPSWYAHGTPFTFAPSANGPGQIWINDSPSPGWPNRDPKDTSLLLREAHAIWKFETYVCVHSEEAPGLFFRRAVAAWQIEVTYTFPNTATAAVTPNLTQMTPDVSADPAKCEVGKTGVNYWLNHIVTFHR